MKKQQQLHHNAKFFADETGLEFLEDFDSFNFPFQQSINLALHYMQQQPIEISDINSPIGFFVGYLRVVTP